MTPLSSPQHTFPPLPKGWIANLFTFMQQTNTAIKFDLKQIPLRRQHDQILMDKATAYTTNKEKLKNINHCQLYLQAEPLADICTAQGDRFHP
jgi:hypothetical protein